MLNRWTGILCGLLMLTANTTLILRDFLPGWMAGDPPELDDLTRGASSYGGSLRREVQTGIFDAREHLVGRSWMVTTADSEFLVINSSTMLNPILLPNGIPTPSVRIDTTLRFRRENGVLSEISMAVRGLHEPVMLRGALITPDEFACQWRLGPRVQGTFRLDAQATRAMGEVLRPFGHLPGLYVGRTWRLQLLDPLAQIMPGLQKPEFAAEYEFARVTGTETITHRGRPVEVFVVEAGRMRAWVTPQGDVLRQEIDLPLVGKLTLRDEPFDADAHRAAQQWPSGSGEDSTDDGGDWLP